MNKSNALVDFIKNVIYTSVDAELFIRFPTSILSHFCIVCTTTAIQTYALFPTVKNNDSHTFYIFI